ncbi:hypothetical protein F5884DRAFT_43021 [Xylogone sp. PMI_703]|nr:hypothetical protein F5884DRAFT_43021 [Xylogone sp. PMI_703]
MVDARPTSSTRALSTLSSSDMNSLNANTTTELSRTGTIRAVPNTDGGYDDSPVINEPPPSRGETSKPYTGLTSDHPSPKGVTRKGSATFSTLERTISTEFGPTKSQSNAFPIGDENTSPSNGANPAHSPQWSSAVGKANLGKSGRVIERLMAENDMLKRDLNIERLRAEESMQAMKMVEAKMDAMATEYETKLHDAAINKTLLKRRERQLADLKEQFEGEKTRADKAMERELTWKDEMERARQESKRKVDEAETYAALMEGRNKTLAGHWKEQGLEVERAASKLHKDIAVIVEERKADDIKIETLQGLCDQQANQLASLQSQKQAIEEAFEKYKLEQEDALKSIKEMARMQEESNKERLEAAQKVLGELKWALGVKKNVRGAE